jgi:hypothetical protein
MIRSHPSCSARVPGSLTAVGRGRQHAVYRGADAGVDHQPDDEQDEGRASRHRGGAVARDGGEDAAVKDPTMPGMGIRWSP